MSIFLKKIGIFLIVPFSLIFISDTYLRNKNSLYKEKFEGALKDAEKIEVLILGNSHANYGVDPTVFDNYAYNIANVNQSFYFDKRMTLKLLKDLKNLNYVLISADYHSLYFSSQGLRDFWAYQGHGIKYKGDGYFLKRLSPTIFGYPPKVILSYLKRDFKNIFFYDNKGLDYPVQKGVSNCDTIKQGFIGYSNLDNRSFSTNRYHSKANIFNQKTIKNKNLEHEIKEDMIEFIEFLKNHSVIPILFSPPTYREYNKFLNQQVIARNKKIYRNISNQHEIPYWNFMNSELFIHKDFFDMDHLNKQGAKKFGRILNDSIKALKGS